VSHLEVKRHVTQDFLCVSRTPRLRTEERLKENRSNIRVRGDIRLLEYFVVVKKKKQKHSTTDAVSSKTLYIMKN